jgi:hypothetical protein
MMNGEYKSHYTLYCKCLLCSSSSRVSKSKPGLPKIDADRDRQFLTTITSTSKLGRGRGRRTLLLQTSTREK